MPTGARSHGSTKNFFARRKTDSYKSTHNDRDPFGRWYVRNQWPLVNLLSPEQTGKYPKLF